MNSDILKSADSAMFAIWFFVGIVFIFWMQAGFAMVETGFTRAKNAGNTLMKNLLDFCIGTVAFILIGFSLFIGEDVVGLIGKPGLDIFMSYGDFDWSGFVFNLVLCATATTIASGALAERTKFLSYCVYAAVVSALIYPVEAHWIWGGGWLADLGFHDYAGSCAVHMVGGIGALIGAKLVGPRIGKYSKDKSGDIVKVNAFPGHNIPLSALGVFILWLGWYGFNGARAVSADQLSSIFLTTTVAPAAATVVCMLYTLGKFGKPDVSMCLNAALAGLVAVSASCDSVDAMGAICIGAVSGFLVVYGIWFLDNRLRVDDPVGSVAVHCFNGIWGTLAVGLFSTSTVPGYSIADASGNVLTGLFSGGGLELLGLQILGILAVGAWAAVTIGITFLIVKAVSGLRVSEEAELLGLDSSEHGLPSAYSGFSIMDIAGEASMDVNSNTLLGANAYDAATIIQKPVTAPVKSAGTVSPTGIYKVVIIAKLAYYDKLKKALNDLGVTGMTVTQVMGCGVQKGAGEKYRGVEIDATLLPKVQVDVVVANIPVDQVIDTVKKTLYTGHIGDGKIFVYSVDRVVKVRTGEENFDALKDVE